MGLHHSGTYYVQLPFLGTLNESTSKYKNVKIHHCLPQTQTVLCLQHLLAQMCFCGRHIALLLQNNLRNCRGGANFSQSHCRKKKKPSSRNVLSNVLFTMTLHVIPSVNHGLYSSDAYVSAVRSLRAVCFNKDCFGVGKQH